MAVKNLMKLAKNNKKPVPPIKKTVEKEKVVLSPADERDLKAKQKVEELLKDVDLTPEKKEEIFEIEAEEPKEGVEWLEEQLTLFSEKNDSLKAELELAKADYAKIFAENQRLKNGGFSDNNNDFVKIKVIELFDEIQMNHIQLGTDPQTGVGNFRIFCPGFLNRMITFFPFLAEYKKY